MPSRAADCCRALTSSRKKTTTTAHAERDEGCGSGLERAQRIMGDEDMSPGWQKYLEGQRTTPGVSHRSRPELFSPPRSEESAAEARAAQGPAGAARGDARGASHVQRHDEDALRLATDERRAARRRCPFRVPRTRALDTRRAPQVREQAVAGHGRSSAPDPIDRRRDSSAPLPREIPPRPPRGDSRGLTHPSARRARARRGGGRAPQTIRAPRTGSSARGGSSGAGPVSPTQEPSVTPQP